MPHSPQPVGPARCRRRSLKRGGARLGEPHAQFDAAVVFDDVELADVGGGAIQDLR